jgi:hypothetical protein
MNLQSFRSLLRDLQRSTHLIATKSALNNNRAEISKPLDSVNNPSIICTDDITIEAALMSAINEIDITIHLNTSESAQISDVTTITGDHLVLKYHEACRMINSVLSFCQSIADIELGTIYIYMYIYISFSFSPVLIFSLVFFFI